VYARPNFCADFQVCSPPEPLWNPRLRQAATTLAAISADSAVGNGQKAKFALRL